MHHGCASICATRARNLREGMGAVLFIVNIHAATGLFYDISGAVPAFSGGRSICSCAFGGVGSGEYFKHGHFKSLSFCCRHETTLTAIQFIF